MFAIVGRRQEAVHQLRVPARRVVVGHAADFVHGGRQSGEIQGEAAEQRDAVGFWRGRQSLRVELREHEGINLVAHPCRLAGRQQVRPDRRLESQWELRSAPCAIHADTSATSSGVSASPASGGGMRLSGSVAEIRCTKALATGFPGAMTMGPPLAISRRSLALREASSGPMACETLYRSIAVESGGHRRPALQRRQTRSAKRPEEHQE